MIDFPVATDPTVFQCVLCTIGFLLVLAFNYKNAVTLAYKTRLTRQRERAFLFFFALLAICYMIDTDFFHYQLSIIRDLDLEDNRWNHFETVYIYIARFVNRNYLLFRIIVWGGASLITYYSFKRFLGQGYYALFFLFVSYFTIFSYSRSSLSMAVYFFGLSFVVVSSGKRAVLQKLIGLALILISYEFHHSILLLIALTPLIFVPLTRVTVVLLLTLIPILSIFVGDILKYVAFNEIFNDEIGDGGVSGRLSNYIENGTIRNMSFMMFVRVWYGYMTFIVSFLFVSYNIFKNKSVFQISTPIIKLYKVSFGLFVVSLSAIFQFGGGTLFYRPLYMLMIPLSAIIIGLYKESIVTKKQFTTILLFNMIYSIIDYIYSIYASSIA